MNKYRAILTIALIAILVLIWAAFSGQQPESATETQQEEQSSGYGGLGK